MYQIGAGKAEITAFIYDKGMMGYAQHFNVVKDIATPLLARAFVIKDKTTGKKVCLVVGDLCFYTIAIKHAVVQQLQQNYPEWGYTDANLMLSAQHTHSGPGGLSHYLAYNISIPGFQPKIFNKVVAGTVEAIVQAEQKVRDGQIHFAQGEFEEDMEVAFNRSLAAYNANPEVKQKVSRQNTHLAIDRSMKLLRFEGVDGKTIGSINWFGVHTTSVSNDNTRLCYDNKGYAAKYLEKNVCKTQGNEAFVAAFAQDTAGDVTPNYKWDWDKKWTRGKYKDDFKSAQFNGHCQYQQAQQLFDESIQPPSLKTGIDCELQYIDFSNVNIDREFVNGKKDLYTAPPAIGINMLRGTVEGPGVPSHIGSQLLGLVGNTASDVVSWYERTLFRLFANRKRKEDIDLKYKMHGKKHIVIEAGAGKIMGTPNITRFVVPSFIDPTIERLKQLSAAGYGRYTPWMPKILPIQLMTIGELAIVGVAAELTTIAGQRLRHTVLRILKHKGIRMVMLATYSNGYHGYITTPEEYDFQFYEGSHTIFGKWTLPAYQTVFKQLSLQMQKTEKERTINQSLQPKIFEDSEIWYG